jgi:outer membrane protein assembly factor BamB
MVMFSLILMMVSSSTPQVELLGQPCRANILWAGRYLRTADNKEWFVLTNMHDKTGMELVFIDFRNHTGRKVRAPAGAGSWDLLPVGDNRLIVGTYYDGVFMVFDLQRMEFVKVADFPKEEYVWNLALGGDGRVYGGTYPGGKLGALDLNTYTVEDCGAPASPNLYLRYVSALPDGRILCSFGYEQPTNLVYDPSTKEFVAAPSSIQGVIQGVTWKGYFLVGSQVLDGKTLEAVEPPFPTPPAEHGNWTVDVNLTTNEVLYLRQGDTLFRYQEGKLEKLTSAELRGGTIFAVTDQGELLGLRGQDYFVLRPGETQITLKPIPVESAPRPTMFLRVDEKGRLWGAPYLSLTLFWMDTHTGKVVNTGKVTDASGQVHDVAFLDGKVYAVAYSAGEIFCFDPDAPWDQWNNVNPRVIANVGQRGYTRPTAGVVLSPGRKLFSGWMAEYGVYGGAVAITDPDTGSTELIENPLGEQAVEGLAVDDAHIYVGTSLFANGLPNKKGEWARFGVIERASRKVVFQHEFEGASGVRTFWLDAKTRRLAFSVDGKLRLFDTAKRELLPPSDAPRVGSPIVGLGDGKGYYASGKQVVQLDLATYKTEVVAELPAAASHVAVHRDGTLFAWCGVDVYRVRRK